MILPTCRVHKEMDKECSLPSGGTAGKSLESGCAKEVSGGFAVRSVFTIRIKAKMSSDYRGIAVFLYLSLCVYSMEMSLSS